MPWISWTSSKRRSDYHLAVIFTKKNYHPRMIHWVITLKPLRAILSRSEGFFLEGVPQLLMDHIQSITGLYGQYNDHIVSNLKLL
jgi:hypothetical protein